MGRRSRFTHAMHSMTRLRTSGRTLGMQTRTSSGLLSTLEDTQASLATALARIEAYRIREKFLLSENYKLKEELKKTEGQTLEEALKATTSRRDLRNKREFEQEEATVRDFASGEGINYRLHEEYPIVLHTKKGKVKPSVKVRIERFRRLRLHFLPIRNISKSLKAKGRSVRVNL